MNDGFDRVTRARPAGRVGGGGGVGEEGGRSWNVWAKRGWGFPYYIIYFTTSFKLKFHPSSALSFEKIQNVSLEIRNNHHFLVFNLISIKTKRHLRSVNMNIHHANSFQFFVI